VAEGERFVNTDTLLTGADRGSGVDGLCDGGVSALREGRGYLSCKNGRIAYVADGGNNSGIYTINPDGGGKSKVTEGFDPSYSPNGKRIAYIRYDGPDTEIFTIKVEGGGKTRVTNNKRDDFTPSYSPDGKKIAYMGYTGLEADDRPIDAIIYTINVGGGGKSQVTDPAYSASEPSWGSRP
jgi:Tol biopolymer transport system component